jgi:hypothetical protein
VRSSSGSWSGGDAVIQLWLAGVNRTLLPRAPSGLPAGSRWPNKATGWDIPLAISPSLSKAAVRPPPKIPTLRGWPGRHDPNRAREEGALNLSAERPSSGGQARSGRACGCFAGVFPDCRTLMPGLGSSATHHDSPLRANESRELRSTSSVLTSDLTFADQRHRPAWYDNRALGSFGIRPYGKLDW